MTGLSRIFLAANKHCPQQRTDHMGLLMLIKGKTIEEVQMGAVILKTSTGSTQCFYKRPLAYLTTDDALIYTIEQTPDVRMTTETL